MSLIARPSIRLLPAIFSLHNSIRVPATHRSTHSTTNALITIHYRDLVDGKDLCSNIETAYGASGLGILAVQGVPNIETLRWNLLKHGPTLANLSKSELLKLEDVVSQYNVGWSHGKEQLVKGQTDLSKGSFYANPRYDDPSNGDLSLRQSFPSYLTPNIWPSSTIPELEPAFKAVGRAMVDVGILLSRHIDRLIQSRIPTYPANTLETCITRSKTDRGRLLHYFPMTAETAGDWCGIHNDHGALTALLSNIYFNAKGEAIPSPDPAAGIHICSRKGNVVQVKLPGDCLAFQIGECAQILSGGIVQATPHFVTPARGAAAAGVSRDTFALFMQPNPWDIVDVPSTIKAETALQTPNLPSGVPALLSRYRDGQTFETFTRRTLHAYYSH